MTRLYRVWTHDFVGGSRGTIVRCHTTWLSKGSAEMIANGFRQRGPAGAVLVSSAKDESRIRRHFGI